MDPVCPGILFAGLYPRSQLFGFVCVLGLLVVLFLVFFCGLVYWCRGRCCWGLGRFGTFCTVVVFVGVMVFMGFVGIGMFYLFVSLKY